MILAFRSFQSRILAFVFTLVTLLLGGVYLAIDKVTVENATTMIAEDLDVGARVVSRLMDNRAEEMQKGVSLLSGDFAFKQACATGDVATILSVLDNHQNRIGAQLMTLVSLDGVVQADTRNPGQEGADYPFVFLLDQAEQEGIAVGVILDGDRAFHVVMAPLLAPMPMAWIVVGFAIDDNTAASLRQLIMLDVSFVAYRASGRRVFASTLEGGARTALEARARSSVDTITSVSIAEKGDRLLVRRIPFFPGSEEAPAVEVTLQRSLNAALSTYDRLRYAVFMIMGVGLAAALITGVGVARTVSRPVKRLVVGVRRIEEGDYESPIDLRRHDEIGELADAVNHMAKGLGEKDRVRTLLGKVVSPAIAEELLSKTLELGGEEREVSVLFSDIRSFTAHSEVRSPHDVLQFLNVYFTEMSAVIEGQGGVIDKYIGDAIMALFGAPLAHPDDPCRAVRGALEMIGAMAPLNRRLAEQRLPQIEMGIGINTGVVVAGNMGSQSRMNYTVIGDGVNLASRIEGLTKKYGVRLLLSGETAAKVADTFLCRPIDLVRVAGKNEPVALYQALAPLAEVTPAMRRMADGFSAAIDVYRERRFLEARKRFDALLEASPDDTPTRLYVERSQALIDQPPPEEWDMVVNHVK